MAALIRPSVRLVPWGRLVGAGMLAAGVVWLAHRDATSSVAELVTMLRYAAVVVVAAAARLLVDPTEVGLAGTPVPVATRRAVRLGVAGPLLAGIWWGLVAYASSAPALTSGSGGSASGGALLPIWAVTVEFGALLAVGLAAGALVWRATGETGAVLAAPVVLVVLLVSARLLPTGWALLADAGDTAAWWAAHVRWLRLGGLGVLVVVACGRDPARRRLRRMWWPVAPTPRASIAVD